MNRKSLYLFLFFSMLAGAIFGQQKPQAAPKEAWNNWYTQMDWLGQTNLIADSSIDQEQLYIAYHKHPERWKLAFDFLKKRNFENLEPGDHELDGKRVFIKVSSYHTADRKEADYELHRHYADIHYVLSGHEYIDTRSDQGVNLVIPYEADRDIEFYKESEPQHHPASPDTFFIFFPGNLHRPGMLDKEDVLVKKLVIKVLCDE